jgi:hypothetical protein
MGTVFAVNSTGYEDDIISYVSCISQILDLTIPQVALPGDAGPREVTVRELLDKGFVLRR